MPIRIFHDGERPSAADFNRYFMQQHSVVKPSTQSVVNSTTLQNDEHLFTPVVANTNYWIWALLFYNGPSGNADFKINWNAPGGSTFHWISDGAASTATGSVTTISRNLQNLGSSPSPGTVGLPMCVPVKGLLKVGGGSGTFRLTWAQLTSNASAVQCLVGSTLIVRRLTS